MFHLVFAASAALTLFRSSCCLRAKGKWRILSVQTLMLQKGFQLRQLSSNAVKLPNLSEPLVMGGKDRCLYCIFKTRDERRHQTNMVAATHSVTSCHFNLIISVQFQTIFSNVKFSLFYLSVIISISTISISILGGHAPPLKQFSHIRIDISIMHIRKGGI